MTKPKEKPLDAQEFKELVVSKYPPKVARKRMKHMQVVDPGSGQEIQANVRTVPGIITQRGCCYAGCRGVVLGPTRDILQIVHGPIGCGFYSWLTRRNQTRPVKDDDNQMEHNFMPYSFSTDMQEDQIIFGGEKKLMQAIREAYEIFKPKCIAIFSTCPIGLIGDDIHQVSRDASRELGIKVFGFSCEGYKGVSQSAGHHIANNELYKNLVGVDDNGPEGKYKINLLGEYNIGGDAFVLDEMFKECGITLVATFSGNSSYKQFVTSHTVDLNAVMCHRSINYMAEMMETKYGIPWTKVNFIGSQATAKSLRKIAEFFGDKALIDKVEAYIEKKLKPVEKVRKDVKKRLTGKKVMLFVGGSRAHHYQELFKEMGMEVLAAGYEFAHRDDYEGRHVLPNIKVDADSRNIEELKIEKDEKLYKKRLTDKRRKELEEKGIDFNKYEGMMPQMNKGSLSIDDLTHYEQEMLLEIYKPDLFCAGIKEKFNIQKHGIPCFQMHSYDYGGPYAGFDGAINFYHTIDRMINYNVWGLIEAPWDKEPELSASYVAV